MPSTQHWLFKTEPTSYSIDDLQRDKKTPWTGVRNYQARNFIRSMNPGDQILIYHSSADPTGIAGLARVNAKPSHDPTALDKKDDHFDPKATAQDPIWSAVEIAFVEKFPAVLPLAQLKTDKRLAKLLVLQRGQRLSIQPVTPEHFNLIADLARA